MPFVTELDVSRPLILVLTEPNLKLSGLVVDFLNKQSLATELILLDQEFAQRSQDFFRQNRTVYKIILMCGFGKISKDFSASIFEFVDAAKSKQVDKIDIYFLSTISTQFSIIEAINPKYEEFLKAQNSFLNAFIKKYEDGLFFLSQDLLLDEQKITNPLLLFLTAVKKGQLLDFQKKVYFQDENSFFEIIKPRLLKPHSQGKFLIRGKAVSSAVLLKKIAHLYEQYYQKKITTLTIFAEERPVKFLNEFSLVKNTKININQLIDQKVRLIPSLNLEDVQSPLSTEILKEISLQSIKKQLGNQSDLNPPKTENPVVIGNLFNFFKKAQKPIVGSASRPVYSEELGQKIEKLFSTRRQVEKQIRQKENLKIGKEIIHKTKKRRWLFWLGLIIFILGFLFVFLFFFFNVSQKILHKQILKVVENNGIGIEKIDKSVLFSIFNFQYINYQKFLLEESLTHAADVIRLRDAILMLSISEADHQKNSFGLYRKTIDGGVDLRQVYEINSKSLEKKIEALRNYNAYLMDLNLDLYQDEERKIWRLEMEETKKEINNSLQNQRFFEAFRTLLLDRGRVNVLILVQDSNELRHTGGLLTELITISFENGVLLDRQVFTVDDLNRRAYGNREAPEEVKNIFQEERYLLHNSNWGPDFAVVATEIGWFVEQVLGQKMDIVIALNSKTNEINFSGESIDQKLKLTDLDFFTLATGFKNGLASREVMLFSDDQALQKVIESNIWSGKKIKATCPAEFIQENCIVDSFFQLEANISFDKTDYLITRKISHDIGITDSFIRHRRRIIFENQAGGEILGYGNHVSYLKFYLHPLANLEKIELNGNKLANADYELIKEDLQQELRLKVLIPRQSRVELALLYTIPNQGQEAFSYVFFDQKQAGVKEKETNYQIVFDENLIPELVAPPTNYQNKTLKFYNNNDDHFLFAIGFSRALL